MTRRTQKKARSPKASKVSESNLLTETIAKEPELEDMIQCDQCSRWVYMDETGFESCEDADLPPSFECKICKKLEIYKKLIDSQHEKIAKIEETNQSLSRKVEQLTVACRAHAENLNILERENEELKKTTQSEKNPTRQEIQALEDKVTDMNAENTAKMEVIESLLNRVQVLEKENGELQLSKQTANGVPSPTATMADEMGQEEGLKGSPLENPNGNEVNTTTKRVQTGTLPGVPTNGRALPKRRVTLLGDSNLNRVKKPLLNEVQRDSRVSVHALPGAKADHILNEMEKLTQTENEENLVLLMAGLNDILNGGEPKDIVSGMTTRMTRWLQDHPNHTLGVCSVPYTKERGHEIQIKIKEVNKDMQAACHATPRMQFINNYHILGKAEASGMVDIHLSPEGSEIEQPATPVMLLGDFNCHIMELDGKDHKSRHLRCIAKKHDLVILNLHEKCTGRVTWTRGTHQTSIDYALACPLWEQPPFNIKGINIDEEKEHSCDSDHNRIKVIITTPLKKNYGGDLKRRKKARWKTGNEDNIQIFATKFEEALTAREEQPDYETFLQEMEKAAISFVGKSRGSIRKSKRKPWCDKEVTDAIRERKRLCRKWREAIKKKADDQDEKRAYQNQQAETKRLIGKKIEQYYKTVEENICSAGRRSGQNFWKYVKNIDNRNEAPNVEVKLHDRQSGKLLRTKNELEQYMTDFFKEQQEAIHKRTSPHETGEQPPNYNDDRVEPIEEQEFERHVKKLMKGKATGPDGIPNEFLKALGPHTKTVLRKIFNNILQTKEIPESWKKSVVRLIHKGHGKSMDDLNSYRPITLQNNTAKLFASIINDRLNKAYEHSLSEAQNGFRRNRRGSDNLFIITQLMELTQKTGNDLYLAFLDLEKAYDAVPHGTVWQKLRHTGLQEGMVQLIRNLYSDCYCTYQLEEYQSGEVKQIVGLKQGCPMSPTLFNVFLNELLQELELSGKGVTIHTHDTKGLQTTTHLPALAFADDIVLLARTSQDLQHLLNLCTKTAELNGMKFSKEKTQWMKIGRNSASSETFSLQNFVITHTNEYKYLGVLLQNQPDYLEKYEKSIIANTNRKKGHIWHLARHSYNPYSVGKLLWKTVAVPAATYANEALCYSTTTIKALERQQREIGKWILRGNMATANTAIEGEIGWSRFEYRDARSKTRYLGRLIHLPEGRYARRLFEHVRYTGIRTEWVKRIGRIDSKYSRGTRRQTTKNSIEWNRCINKEMKKIENEDWNQRTTKKQSLALYNSYKSTPAPFNAYRGDRQSGLLFQARTGALLTRQRLAQLFRHNETTCILCGEEEEDIGHVLFRCPATMATRPEGADIATALGLTTPPDDGSASDIVETTRRHLTNWDRLTASALRAKPHNGPT
ncbi:uncharacterized protein LOC135380802 [Ornithodoros turicata]|uniref:uncharacterized protein LOC135380802 n=1 Tax=Ornithodoros turicata TaxID=34597 RepID=UPI00313895D1